MRRLERIVLALAVGVASAGLARATEQSTAPTETTPAAPSSMTDLQKAHQQFDTQYKEFYTNEWYNAADANHDGVLSLEEANAAPKLGPDAGLDTVRFQHADLNGDGVVDLNEAKGEKAWEIAHHEQLDQFFQNHPNLAADLVKYPNAAEYLAGHPKVGDFLKAHPEIATTLAEHPAAAQKLANNPAAAKFLREHEEVRKKIAQHPEAAKVAAEHPGAVGEHREQRGQHVEGQGERLERRGEPFEHRADGPRPGVGGGARRR